MYSITMLFTHNVCLSKSICVPTYVDTFIVMHVTCMLPKIVLYVHIVYQNYPIKYIYKFVHIKFREERIYSISVPSVCSIYGGNMNLKGNSPVSHELSTSILSPRTGKTQMKRLRPSCTKLRNATNSSSNSS